MLAAAGRQPADYIIVLMDIKILSLFVVALAALSGAIGATVSRRRGDGSARGMLKIALLAFPALFAGIAASIYLLVTFFPT
jgi:hypothetical protein